MMKLSLSAAVVALSVALAAAGAAQRPLTEQEAAGGQFKIDDQGTAVTAAAQRHIDIAGKAAGQDFQGGLALCNLVRPDALKLTLPTSGERAGTAPSDPAPQAARVFDNLYYLGTRNVSAWAVATPEGIILIDALNQTSEMTDIVEPGLRKFGLDPAQIKYVIVTHGHGDHFGGSLYLAQKYHARVLMSDYDWKLAPTMLNKPFYPPPAPRDITVRDGQKLTLGGETIRLYVTPGHTLGTVSLLVPVTENGRRHVAVMMGGNGFNFPHSVSRFQLYANSADRLMRLALAAGADVPLSNHPDQDLVVRKIARMKAQPGAPNPFVMGKDGVRRFLTVYKECALAYAAQMAR